MTDHQDDQFDRVMKATLRRPADVGADASCLDAETMAAWMDGGLTAADIAAAEAHAAVCARCQALAAAMVRSEPAGVRPAAAASESGTTAVNRWARWGIPLAAAALIVLAVWLPRRADDPRQDSTIASAPAVEPAPSLPPGNDQPLPPPSPAAERPREPPQAAPADRQIPGAPPAADPPEVQPERARAEPAAPPASSTPSPATSADAAAAAENRSRIGGVPPPQSAAPPATARAFAAAPPIVIAEFAATDALVQERAAGAATPVDGRAADRDATAGAVAGRPAQQGQQADAGRGGRGGSAQGVGRPRADSAMPIRWRVLSSGEVQQSRDLGVSWEPVAIGGGVRVANGSAPTPLVSWLVGAAGVVLLTTDGATFTRLPFPEAVDLASVRATNARVATVTAVDGRRFATVDGGQTWTRP